MIQAKGPWKGLWYTFLLLSLFLLVRHYELIWSPNSLYIGDSHDGFRSHMAARYHVIHDSSLLHFEGMNYPYGDRVGFTDNQPLLTNPIKWLSGKGLNLAPYTIGILQSSLLLSMLLSGLFLYLLFWELNLPIWYSVLAAVGIAILTPQADRFTAHYGLAHAFVIPMILYLLKRYDDRPNWKLSLWIGFLLLLVSQLHFYLFAIGVFTIGFYTLFRWLPWPGFPHVARDMAFAFLQVGLPLILLLSWNAWIDPIADRTTRPFGVLAYQAHWQTVFFSADFHSGRILTDWFWGQRGSIEGQSYVGAVVTLFLLIEAVRRLIKWQPFQIPPFAPAHRLYLLRLFGAGIGLLLFALAIPFTIHPFFETWLDYLGPIRQFRSLGRFAWGFFYIANVVIFYWIYQIFRDVQDKRWQLAGLLLALGILWFEAVTFNFKKRYDLIPRPEDRQEYKAADNPWLDLVDTSRFQAILPIPYFHIGSENIWQDINGKTMHRALWASVQTGIPNMASFLGRTSLSQTINQMEWIAEPYRRPQILDDFPDDRSILLFIVKSDYEKVWYRFNHLLYGIKPIYEDDHLKLYDMPPSLIEQRIAKRHTTYLAELDTLKRYPHQEVMSKDSLKNFIYLSFDEQKTEQYYRGGGAFQGIGDKDNILFEGQIPQQQKEGYRYVLSLWAYIGEDMHPKTIVTLNEQTKDGQTLQNKGYHLFQYMRSFENGWVLIDIPIYLKSEESQIRLLARNNDLRGQAIYIDELQIRPQKAIIVKRQDGEFARNNRWFLER
ncbi:MAG: hypothetical protein AAFP19_18980 [Bacteroidota bacterium]